MKVWITKYALTQGVFIRDVEDCGDGMVADHSTRYVAYYHREGRDWHRTRKSAIDRVEEMRGDAIAAAQRKLDKLKKLRVEVTE